MQQLKIRLALVATLGATLLLALLPGTTYAAFTGWSDRTKKAGVVPVAW